MTLARVQTRPDPATTAASEAPSVHVVTFGCQMNKYDSLLVEGRFRARGYRLSEGLEQADVVLFNTCSVRDHAEERVFSWLGELRSLKQRRPDVVVGVLGCMAQRTADEIFARAGHVDLVCGTRKIHRLPELVEEVRERRADPARGAREQRLLEIGVDDEVAVDRSEESYPGGLNGYLAVMRGCDLNCTFCIVPRVRGRVQSRPIEDLLAEARWMVAGGARVLTLLGQTVNAYGEDLPAPDVGRAGRGRGGRPGLADLLRRLQELEGLVRIRLITLHPSYVTRELARAIAECDKVDRFLPLPAQSGSDAVLRRMRRGYTTDLYRSRLDLLREVVPDIELGSDWIVGFPGESDADFQATLAFLAEIGTIQNYVFQYSPRPDTRAWALDDDVPLATKKARNQELLRASERVSLARYQARIGSEQLVFAEQVPESSPDKVRGRTRHNLPLTLPGTAADLGQTLRVQVEHATPFGLYGVRGS